MVGPLLKGIKEISLTREVHLSSVAFQMSAKQIDKRRQLYTSDVFTSPPYAVAIPNFLSKTSSTATLGQWIHLAEIYLVDDVFDEFVFGAVTVDD